MFACTACKDTTLTELFNLATNDGDGNDSHRKQNIISAVIAAGVELRKINQQAKNADKDTKKILSAKANVIFEDCLKVVSKNITSDHVLHMVLKELDNKKSKYKIAGHRSLIFAMLLYEPNARLTKSIKNFGEYACDNLMYYDEEADADTTEFYKLEYI